MGDLQGPGGGRRRRSPARGRADDLPRPRRQHRPGRRADPRGDPRAAAGTAAGPVEADGAGRDDLVQVRPAGARRAEPRGGPRGNAPVGVPPGRERPLPAGRATRSIASRRSRTASTEPSSTPRRSSPSSASSRRSTSSRCSRSAPGRPVAPTTRTSCARFVRFPGCSHGRRTVVSFPPGTAAAPPSPQPTEASCASSTGCPPSFAPWSRTSR